MVMAQLLRRFSCEMLFNTDGVFANGARLLSCLPSFSPETIIQGALLNAPCIGLLGSDSDYSAASAVSVAGMYFSMMAATVPSAISSVRAASILAVISLPFASAMA